ncbi:MAG: pyrroloquinoline quinone biosynthesis peptide chaperone PqqD [Polyangiaceae bacterium]
MSRELPKLASKARLRWDKIEQKHLLLYPERGLVLNKTGAAILAMCDGKHTVEMMAASFQDADKNEILEQIKEFLDEMGKKGLLEP